MIIDSSKPHKGKKALLAVASTIVSLILLVTIGTVAVMAQEPEGELRLAPLNPDFLDYIRNPPAKFYGYIPSPVDMRHLKDIPVGRAKTMRTLLGHPATFDWRTSGKVTPVKDQNPCGTCWIFGTLAALESKVLIGESNTYDFSEQNVACCTDPSWVYLAGDRCMGGGWASLAADTLSKKGTRLEACDPYDTGTIDTDTCNDDCTTTKYITGYRQIAVTDAAIKDAVYDHGPVSVPFYWNSDNFNSDTNIYYYTGSSPPNHLVCIIGWDDTIAHPEGGGSGAWIVKNSWGTDWGGTCNYGSERGYFYLCYGSGNMGESAYYEYSNYSPSEKIYYWDEAGMVSPAGYTDSDYAWMANVFTMSANGNITQVDFWATSNNATYEINVCQDNDPTDGLPAPLSTQLGSCLEAGYYSIALDSPVSVTSGQTYTIAVKMTTSGYNYPIPVEHEWEVSPPPTVMCSPPIQTGVSYARHEDTDTWADLAPNYNVCLRARVQEDTVSVSVSPTTVEYGIVALGTSQDTVTLNQHITVTNNGDVTEDFSIKSSDATRVGGTTWELVTGTPGTNEFKHEFSINGTDWTTMPADNDYATLANSIEVDSSVTVYLRITMPSSTPDALEHTIVVTIMALESG